MYFGVLNILYFMERKTLHFEVMENQSTDNLEASVGLSMAQDLLNNL